MRRVCLLLLSGLFLITAGATAAPVPAHPTAQARSSIPARVSTRPAALLFGDRSIEPVRGRASAGQAQAFELTDAVNGKAQSIAFYVPARGSARIMTVGIYSNANGHPGTLLRSASVSAPKSRGWHAVSIKATTVYAGRRYWIALLSRGGAAYFRHHRQASCTVRQAIATGAKLAAAWRHGSYHADCRVSAYVAGTRLGTSPGHGTVLSSPTSSGAPTQAAPASVTTKPANTAAPSITGTVQQTHSLTANHGSWTGAPTAYAYQWQRCKSSCANISGATSSTYTLGSGDVGDTIDVTVTATNTGGSTTATSAQTSTVTASSGSVLDGLKVSGANMVDDTGTIVHLHGVNRSGTEYQCAHGAGFFDGPSDAASVAAMASWHINIVRVPINALCWLGDNGVPSQYGGQNYINAIVTYVNLLHSYGIYAEISLMWSMPGNLPANESYQINAPDQDHAPATWTGMAQAFKNDPNVILSPWGETYVDYPCLMQGCSDQASIGGDPGDSTGTCGSGCWHYQSAGMQEAVTDMRNAGYNGPIAIPCDKVANICADPNNGGSYANGTWLTTKPTDPDNQILAEMHLYGGNTCDTTTCLNTTIKPILNAGYPVIFGETGDSYDGSTCPGTTNLQTYLTWAEQNNVGTEAWAWDTWGGCSTGSLITNYNGTPNTGQGTLLKTTYLTFPANP